MKGRRRNPLDYPCGGRTWADPDSRGFHTLLPGRNYAIKETNFDKSKVVTRRPIKWEEIDFPQEWVIENATQPQNNVNTEVSEIEQLNDGTVKIRFHEPNNMLTDNRSMSSRISRSNSSYISPVDYTVQVPSRASTSQIRETYRCDNIKIDRDNIVKPIRRASSDLDITESEMNFPDGITENDNRFSNYSACECHNYANIYMSILGEHIMSLHEKVDKLLTLLPTKVKGKEKVTHSSLQPPPDIEDFKIKDYSDLESFLEKKFKGGGVQPLDTAGFTGQLKGWWDNYLNQTQRDTVLMAVKQEGDQITQNAVYTLVLNIIEHFSGRWSDNSETIRTLLQNLRCKTLTSFRYYKDVFLCRVMELPECNSTHWKSKFIDGLPTLFAERVRRSLRGDDHSINYDNYTYGKLISACVQEGLALCNEIKLNQQIKRHRLTERKQLGEFCEQFAFDIPKQKSKDLDSSSHKKKKSSRKDYEKWKKKKIEKKLRRAEEGRGDSFKRKKKYRNFNKSDTCHKCGRYGHYAKDCRVKEKIKNLDIDDNMKDSLYKIMLNSDSGSGSEYNSREYSSTSEDLKALQQEEYGTSEDECSPCQQGMACEKDDEDDLYKIYEQFKEMSLNVIDNDKVIELLQDIKDPEIRAQIIDKISDSKGKDHFTEKDYIPKEIPTKEGSYTMAEVKNLLLERRKMVSSPTTISDLKEEINNLKEDITLLKEKNVVIEVRLDAIQTLRNLDNASESSSSMEGENDNLDFIKNLRGRGGRSNSGRGGHILAQQGNRTLTSFNVSQTTASSSSGTSGGVDINHPMYKEFMDFMKSKKETSSSTTYSSVLIDDENIEVAFNPLTLRGLPESFIAALRDGRNHNWKKSLIGTIQTSLAYGPVYFNAYPNLQISLQDENSLSSLMLNVKLHGYDYMPGTEVVCICYRIYYKLLHTLNPMCKVIDFKNETILIETNFDKSKVVTRRPIKWEEIDFPQEWVIENATQPQNNVNTEVSEIEQLNDGTVKIRFHEPTNMFIDNRSMSSRISRSNSSYISPVDYTVQVPSRASTSQIRETYRCDNIKIDRDNIVKPIRRASSDLDITESEMNFPDGITG
ncbi:hypothetical protein H5410_015658 [Solanum commersonii]|uniref:CCHC-type domain-containing protein n=1 Tax=Solanum commersonii TaxID=4109 RepID=A0A9J5ZV26_SOLCO|nr:hypothetical protein H5410_015658 [Solanum commersonii]